MAPFFVAAQLYTRLGHGIARPTGFEPVSIAAVSAGSAFYGMLGVLVVFRICRCFTSSSRAVLSAGLVLLGTPLLYYTYRQPIMAHSTSFLASASLMLICLLVYHQRLDLRVSGLAIGVCIGLNFLMRWTGVLLALVPLTFWIVFSIDAFRRGERAALRRAGVQFVIAGMASAITVLPQLALWHQLHGRWLVFPPQDFSTARLAANISNVFISTNRGLVFWSPVMLLGMIGLCCCAHGPSRWPRCCTCSRSLASWA